MIPEDRTIKQPSKGFCRNPECRTEHGEFQFEVVHEAFECPKCGANRQPMVGMLVMTHLILPKKGGPIRGVGGLQFYIACDDTRAYMATTSNLEAASDNPAMVNCPACVDAVKKLCVKKPTGANLNPESVSTIVDKSKAPQKRKS